MWVYVRIATHGSNSYLVASGKSQDCKLHHLILISCYGPGETTGKEDPNQLKKKWRGRRKVNRTTTS